jgi:cobalamin biosynthesis Mg chelatase CobN
MKQGRKSRTAVGLGCALLVFVGCLTLAPGFAAAQSAVDEYASGDIPDPDSDEPGDAGGSSGSDDSSGGAAAPPPSSGSGGSGSGPTASAPVTEGGNNSGNGNGGGKAEGKGDGGGANAGGANAGGGSGDGQGDSAQASTETPALTATSSDDGGAPVLLIALAVLAAVCTGIAIWRMRRNDLADRQTRQAQTGSPRVSPPTSQT